MSEFSFDHGSIGKGIVAAVLGGLKYLILPLLIVIMASSLLARVEGQEIASQIGLDSIMIYIFIIGVPITILSFFRGFYPKGSRSRFAFGAVVAALACLWIWMVTNQGNLALEFDQFGMAISFTGLVLLFILGAALKGVYYLVEMYSYREEWLRSRDIRPVIGSNITP